MVIWPNMRSALCFQDMHISAAELRTILNKIVSKRKLTTNRLCGSCLAAPRFSWSLFSSTGSDIKTDGFTMETCRVMVNLMDVSLSYHFVVVETEVLLNLMTKSGTDGWLSVEACAELSHLFCCTSSTPLQNSTDGKLGLGEFATLWKKVQRYLVRSLQFFWCSGQVMKLY